MRYAALGKMLRSRGEFPKRYPLPTEEPLGLDLREAPEKPTPGLGLDLRNALRKPQIRDIRPKSRKNPYSWPMREDLEIDL